MNQDDIYYQATKSLCDVCMKPVDAKIVFNDNKVFVVKTCPEHGQMRHLLEENAGYHLKKVLYDKPSTPHVSETPVEKGCPFDCGLCPSHSQHSCIGLIEVTDHCDLGCPVCYASSGKNGTFLSLPAIERMLDFFVESEGGAAEILQISGGEPTSHPRILEILQLCKTKNIGHVMLNTNGVRLAQDEDFVRSLAGMLGGLEVYLQFDSLQESVYEQIRGLPMLETKRRAIASLDKYNIPTTLVCTVLRGQNDREAADLIKFGLETSCVRGVNFQPAARFGGHEGETEDPYTVSGVIRLIADGSGQLLKEDDFVPLPCNVERVAVTYLYKRGSGFVPITRSKHIEKYVPHISNTFLFTIEDALADGQAPTFGFCKCLDFLNDFSRIVPKGFMAWPKEARVKYLNENTFRITISSFVDKYNFDLKSMQKECVHVITEDLRRIPFSAYNLLHRRPAKEQP